MKILGDYYFWDNHKKSPSKVGRLDRYLHSRMLQLETLECRIVPTIYMVTNTNDDALTGSLRAAINLVNADNTIGPHTINFAINPGTGAIQTINLATALPLISKSVIIDGTTQSGYSANTLSVGAGNNASIKIQLNGSIFTSSSGIVGLYFNSAGSTVKGLSIVNFPYAIYANNDNITISGNYFGVNADGTAQTNALSGVGVDVANANSAFVGTSTAADQNIFGNLTTGILQVAGSNSSFVANRIGLGTTNTSFMPNNIGIQINNFGTTDAVNHSITGNLIGKNTTGIKLFGLQGGSGTVAGTQIVGNFIGTDSAGSTTNLGNSGDAISIANGVTNTTIGSLLGPNTIAYSSQNGVLINGASSVGNKIQYNNIRDNLGLGIVLLNGANSNILAPVITQQSQNVAGFTYSGFVNGAVNTSYTVDFYSSLISDSRSQGTNYLGSTTVTTDASGKISFTGFAPTQNQAAQGAGYVVTAIATNNVFGTSQFSAGPPAQISVVSGSGQSTLVNSAFANPLVIKVVDSRGDPVHGIQVPFSAPNSNPANPATGLFTGSLQTYNATTNVAGEATSTILTANNAAGNFTVLSRIVVNSVVTSVSFALTNTLPLPTITSFSPGNGPAGTVVIIVGTHFAGTTVVKFNGTNTNAFTVIDSNRISAIVPIGASTGPIKINTPHGTVTSSASFTIPSIIASFSISPVDQGQPIFTGVPVRLKLLAINSSGGVITNFVGVVNITSTDLLAVIPTTATFLAVDNGVVEITATFFTAGPVTVTVANAEASGSGTGAVIQSSTGAFQTFPIPTQIPFPLGVSITKTLATVSGITQATLSDFVATINWGDGTANSIGAIIPAPSGSGPNKFEVLGTHTYNSLSLFTGTVTVRRISDNTSSSASFSAFVLSPSQNNQLNQVDGVRLPPGDKFASAGVTGLQTNFLQPAGNPNPVFLINSSFKSNPELFSTTLPAQSFFDIRLKNPPANSFLSITLNFTGGLQRGSSPYIQFAQDDSTSYQNVISNNNLVIINYINGTITVIISDSSFPLITNLGGTVFAVVTNTTQVSSNTVTTLPNNFSGGTAVSISWGDSSTVVDVRNSSSSLTFQNSRQTTLSLSPSQSSGTVLLRAMNYSGTTPEDAQKETLKILTNPDVIQRIIRGTIGIGPEVIGSMIKKMMPENMSEFFKQWSKVISDSKTVSSDIIMPAIKAPSETNCGSSPDKPKELDDAAFEDMSEITQVHLSEDEFAPSLNGLYPEPIFDELAFCGEINWAGLALSTLALSQFCTFSRDKPKPVCSIKILA